MKTIAITAFLTASTGVACAQAITPDGALGDWPEGLYATADGVWLHGRFEFQREVTLHGAPFSTLVHIDADADTKTGEQIDGMGVDLVVEFSPTRAPGVRRWGPEITTHTDRGGSVIDSMQIDFHAAPTASSRTFEYRLRRDLLADVLGLDPESTRAMAVRVVTPDGVRAIPSASAITRVEMPPLEAAVSGEPLPARPEGAVRVMTWNVLWGSPVESPGAFARILTATRPDIVLVQEWGRDGVSDRDIASWFDSHAAWGGSWTAAKPIDVWGAAVLTHHTMTGTGPEAVYADGTRWDFPVRVAAATIQVDGGPSLAVASTHLKCCGHLGSDEDHRRLVEASAINNALRALADSTNADHILLGGDFNTDGTLAMLDVATMGLDDDGTTLDHAEPAVLGDNAFYTFGRPGMNTERKRLDYLLYPDAAAAVVNAFVLDTARLTNSTLERAGLQRADSAASDHLPVVVDLVFEER
ncbi:MAG: endonuclease/exonuclease/phosphatase family protein [Planctomycetota bacterium]